MRSGILFFICFFLSIHTFTAQVSDVQKYAKIKIDLTGKDLRELSLAGLETDHGIYVKNRYLINDFSYAELKVIKSLGFEMEVLIDDVSAYYSDPLRSSDQDQNIVLNKGNCDGPVISGYNYPTPSQYKSGSMGGYFTYQEMMDILDTMAQRYPDIISQKKIIDGFSTQNGNHLFYVKVSDHVSDDDSDEPEILYTALHHAREPNSLSQMIFYLWYLLENYKKDSLVTKIIDNTQLYFVPCVNPDGYILNQTSNPNGGGMWRKNAWKDAEGNLKGVDLNRNYGFFWGFNNSGSSTNPNSQTYRGQAAFSEPETQAIRALCLERNFVMALNYHTFGNYLIHPWGYNDLPTGEDGLFKSIGYVMNRENNFALGTGLETVGYTVNGDSDDWMYGELGEKNVIYTLTPEVGPSFWPASSDIDYLNKSCVWMNLSAAFLTLNYYTAEEVNVSKFLSPGSKNIYINVSRPGLKDGSAVITLTSNTAGITVKNPSQTISLSKGESLTHNFELELDENLSYRDGILLNLEVNNDGLVTTTEIRKQWKSKEFSTIWKNDLNNKEDFVSDGWAITDKLFHTAPSSVTDSGDGNYPSNYEATITLKVPVDLSQISDALLTFYARWDIENNYDYVQVSASKDNNDFIPLCGKYTNPGTREQALNSPLYDGLVSDWVKEEIDLSAFAGQPEVWIRFAIHSGAYLEKDGFYFDELAISGIQNTTNTQNDEMAIPYIYPNVWSGQTTFNLRGISPAENVILHVFNSLGNHVLGINIRDESAEINTTGLHNGVYFYEVTVGNARKSKGKLIIINSTQ